MALIDILKSQVVNLPYKRNSNEPLKGLLERNFEAYLSLLKAEPAIHEILITKVYKVIECIHQAMDHYYIGKLSVAYNYIDHLMQEVTLEFDTLSEFYRKRLPNIYYRMRVSKEMLTDKKELFHVPFDKRHVIGNERYSTAGYPCLYLGSTPYTCWEEYSRPDANEVLYFSKYQLPSDYKYIELALLPYELKDRYYEGEIEDDKILISYITILPIIMACSVRVPKELKAAPFKAEYVIPQLICQWLISSNNQYDGISYFSVATATYSKKNWRLYQNLAIPVKSLKEEGFCKELMKHIKFTDPVGKKIDVNTKLDGYSTENYCQELLNTGLVRIHENKCIHYSDSIFAAIEEELSKKACTLLID